MLADGVGGAAAESGARRRGGVRGLRRRRGRDGAAARGDDGGAVPGGLRQDRGRGGGGLVERRRTKDEGRICGVRRISADGAGDVPGLRGGGADRAAGVGRQCGRGRFFRMHGAAERRAAGRRDEHRGAGVRGRFGDGGVRVPGGACVDRRRGVRRLHGSCGAFVAGRSAERRREGVRGAGEARAGGTAGERARGRRRGVRRVRGDPRGVAAGRRRDGRGDFPGCLCIDRFRDDRRERRRTNDEGRIFRGRDAHVPRGGGTRRRAVRGVRGARERGTAGKSRVHRAAGVRELHGAHADRHPGDGDADRARGVRGVRRVVVRGASEGARNDRRRDVRGVRGTHAGHDSGERDDARGGAVRGVRESGAGELCRQRAVLRGHGGGQPIRGLSGGARELRRERVHGMGRSGELEGAAAVVAGGQRRPPPDRLLDADPLRGDVRFGRLDGRKRRGRAGDGDELRAARGARAAGGDVRRLVDDGRERRARDGLDAGHGGAPLHGLRALDDELLLGAFRRERRHGRDGAARDDGRDGGDAAGVRLLECGALVRGLGGGAGWRGPLCRRRGGTRPGAGAKRGGDALRGLGGSRLDARGLPRRARARFRDRGRRRRVGPGLDGREGRRRLGNRGMPVRR